MRKHSFKMHYIMAVLFVFGQFGSLAFSVLQASPTYAAGTVEQVSTGDATSCAVTSGIVKCWGSNTNGILGIGTTTGTKTSPVAINMTAFNGKKVTKVSVGTTHACAISDASVYCWGDNTYGQLGNGSKSDSSIPVLVNTKSTNPVTTAAYCNGIDIGFGCWGTTVPAKTVDTGASSLANQEVIDISAGNGFTCALSSDGQVSCWGDNYYGELGSGPGTGTAIPTQAAAGTKSTTANVSVYPKAVYTKGVLAGKDSAKLAKAANGSAMCVLAVDSATNNATGSPYCWGYGVGTAPIPATTSKTVSLCSSGVPSSSTSSVYANTDTPVKISGSQLISQVDGNTYFTGLGADSKVYYWGMHGYAEDATYTKTSAIGDNTTDSQRSSEVARTDTVKIDLAMTGAQAKANAQSAAKKANTGGGDKNTALNSNNKTVGVGSTYSSITTSGGANYQGVSAPNPTTTSSGAPGVGGNKATTTSCTSAASYKVTLSYREIGTLNVTGAPSSSLTQTSLITLAGNSVDGLFCAQNTAGTYCDAHGTSVDEGQTGSNYTKTCHTTYADVWGLKVPNGTACDPAPTGPQQVVSGAGDWLNSKTVTSLSVGASGYTCAIASSTLACWGLNTSGQLGNGTTTNKNVPTVVTL